MVQNLDAFNVTDATYKSIEGNNVELSILIPKDLRPGTYPLVVRFHGGFLITGSRLYPDWFAQWLIEYVLAKPCILISADYRLMPEATGSDILSDISDFWAWINAELSPTLSPVGFAADLNSILVVGESAGGYMAIQSALLHHKVGIKAAISQYGVLDVKTRFFMEAYEKRLRGAPMLDPQILYDHIEAVKEGKLPRTVSHANPPARMDITQVAVQQGRIVEFLGDASENYPMENLERIKDPPALWILHGSEDSAVPVEGSHAFAEKLKKLQPNTSLLLTIEAGDHGFDMRLPLSTPWIKNGMEFISKHWPGGKMSSDSML